MPLSSAKVLLEQDLEAAYVRSMEAGAETGASPEDIIINMSNDIAFAINEFVLAAKVTTEVVTFSQASQIDGKPDPSRAQADSAGGMTTSDGKGSGEGTVTGVVKVKNILWKSTNRKDEEGEILRSVGAGMFEVKFKDSIETLSHADIEPVVEE